MRGQTQKARILLTLQIEGTVRIPVLWNISTNYRRWVKELREEGYDIRCIETPGMSFYQLRGNKEYVESDVVTSLQAA